METGEGGKLFLKMAKKKTNKPSPLKKTPNNPGYALQVAIRKSGKKRNQSKQRQMSHTRKKERCILENPIIWTLSGQISARRYLWGNVPARMPRGNRLEGCGPAHHYACALRVLEGNLAGKNKRETC